jgi:Na+:H+ antiporter, NhaA family
MVGPLHWTSGVPGRLVGDHRSPTPRSSSDVSSPSPVKRATWLGSDRFLARNVARPITRFLRIEAAGGILLAAAALVALVWANSPWSDSYEELWSTVVSIDLGGHGITEDLAHWISDGLMTLFFFVIGLEIKQELTDGHLASARAAFVPAAGALGGMIVPAAIYAAVNAGGAGSSGWGIPMATDVAFALGALALLGRRVPTQLKVMLLGLAIVDDIGAIAVIAAFYSDGLDWPWLLAALAGLLAVLLCRRARVWFMPVYVVLGVFVWFAMFQSGVHATLAGVAIGLLTPARPLLPPVDADRIADRLSADTHVTADDVRAVSFRLREAIPVTQRLQDLLHPWTGYVIVPLFALASAGVRLSADTAVDAASSPVTLGVVGGLVLGKLVGVAGAITAAVRWGGGELPPGVTGRHVLGMAGIAGIGFTVSLFVTGLAFEDAPGLAAEAKLGVLAASCLAAAVGVAVLLRSPATAEDADAAAPAAGAGPARGDAGPRATLSGGP